MLTIPKSFTKLGKMFWAHLAISRQRCKLLFHARRVQLLSFNCIISHLANFEKIENKTFFLQIDKTECNSIKTFDNGTAIKLPTFNQKKTSLKASTLKNLKTYKGTFIKLFKILSSKL